MFQTPRRRQVAPLEWLARLMFALLVLFPAVTPAAVPTPLAIDPAFGGGRVITPVGPIYDWAFAIAVQPDGKVVAAGTSSNGTDADFALVRYNADGSLDAGFGTGGKVTTAIGPRHDNAYALVVQADGKLVLAGDSENGSNVRQFALVRYNADGSLDTGFGTGGKVITAVGSGHGGAHALVMQADGKLVAAGHSSNGGDFNFALVRYNPNGTLDTGFGSGGTVTAVPSGWNDYITSLVLQGDGKLVAAGYSETGAGSCGMALARFDTAGALDTGFGTGGMVTPPLEVRWTCNYALGLQSNGKLLVAGTSSNGTNDDFMLTRYGADGTLDTAFGSSGKVMTPVGSSEDHAYALVVQGDDKAVVAGVRATPLGGPNIKRDFALVRYNSDGSLDAGFGTGGKVTTALGASFDYALTLAIQGDGKLVAGGFSQLSPNANTADFALARYDANGSLDHGFGGGVPLVLGISGPQVGGGLVRQGDGKLVVAGTAYNGTNKDFAVVRINSDGSPDSGFGTNGTVITAVDAFDDSAAAVALQPDGRLVVAGYSSNGSDYDFSVVRYQTDGALDGSFGNGGKVVTPIGSSYDYISAVALQADGKVVVAGYSDSGGNYDFALARYDSSGVLDNGFGTGGKVVTAVGSIHDYAQAIAIQGDGKLVVAGYCFQGLPGSDICTVRYNADGTLDGSFGTGGKVLTPAGSFNGNGVSLGVAIQSDGKVVVGGVTRAGNYDFVVLRYNADGLPDTGFGTNGKVVTPVLSTTDAAFNLTIQSDGKLVVAGNSSSDFALVRYTTQGAVEAIWTGDGKHLVGATALVIEPDGNLVAAGAGLMARYFALAQPATHFAVTAPAGGTAGSAVNVTVTALDLLGNVDTGYSGVVHFTSSDGAAALPADAALTNGTGTFPVTLNTAGSHSITATDTVTASITGSSNTVAVAPGGAVRFTVSAPAGSTAGSAVNVTVTALDGVGNVATGYGGTVHFTSSDGAATLPADAPLTGGTGTFPVTFRTAGGRTITATDTATASITGTSGSVVIAAGATVGLTVSAPASAAHAVPVNVTVTALDGFGNVVAGYTGTVHFTSTSPGAQLPADSTLTNGSGTFPVSFVRTGIFTVTATDTANPALTGTSGSIAVSPPPVPLLGAWALWWLAAALLGLAAPRVRRGAA